MNDIKKDMFEAFLTGLGADAEWIEEVWDDGLTLEEAEEAWTFESKEKPLMDEWYQSYAKDTGLI